ncbi:YolD-like family protein [Solibacillus cecembensis]|uniref:YolD-like family protein n=1 Tax=Solibacillus cecembensis TaxID=459347 RepID=UPI003CFE1838
MTFTPIPKPAKGSKPKKLDKPQRTTPSPPKEKKHLDRDEFELEEIAVALGEAKEEKKLKVFTVYRMEEHLQGAIIKMDANTKLIHIRDKVYGVHKVHFLDILKVSDVTY